MTTYPTWAETPEGRWPQILEQARMSESMVERVARAIGNADAPGYVQATGHPEDVEAYTRMARAAIEAMREPTARIPKPRFTYDSRFEEIDDGKP